MAQVLSSAIGPVANETALFLFNAGTFDSSNIYIAVLNMPTVNTLISAADDPFVEGEYTLAVFADTLGHTGTYDLGLIGAIFGWSSSLQDIQEDLTSSVATFGRLAAGLAGGNIRQNRAIELCNTRLTISAGFWRQ